MHRVQIAWVVAGALGAGACGDREPPPPPPPPPAAQPVRESLPAQPDTLRGDSIMVRDTARVPQ